MAGSQNSNTTDETTVALAEGLRRRIASRRDRLVALQRRGYSTARAALIERLGDDYRAALAISLAAGVESVVRS